MVEIGERSILWHIMTIHSHRRFDHSVTCLGYNLTAALKWAAFEALHDQVFCVKGLPKMRAALTSQRCERGVTPAAIRTDVWQ